MSVTIVTLLIRGSHSMRFVGLFFIFVTLQGCVSSAPDPAATILGTWESSLGGFHLVSTYSETEVTIDGYQGVSYTLEGNRLMVDGDRASFRLVDFPAANVMVQIDPVTNTEHRYTRQ